MKKRRRSFFLKVDEENGTGSPPLVNLSLSYDLWAARSCSFLTPGSRTPESCAIFLEVKQGCNIWKNTLSPI